MFLKHSFFLKHTVIVNLNKLSSTTIFIYLWENLHGQIQLF